MSRLSSLALAITVSSLSATPALAEEGHAGLSPAAEKLFTVFGLPVTNSMVMSWIVAIALIIIVRIAAGRPKLVPGKGQAVVESLVQGVYDLIAPIVGKKAARPAFPLLVGLFTFILIQNWSSLIPGVGTFKVFEGGEWRELVRPANADMNATFGMAAVAMLCWAYFIFRYAGPKAVFHDIFGNKADKREVPALIYYPLFVIFFGVGLIEIISIAFRPVSLSFRLFGNVFGGENLLHSMSAICKWGVPVPFYFMELLVGLVQALVFTLLVSVYIGLICNHGDDHEEGASQHH